MSFHIKNRNVIPYGGEWRYIVPETKHPISGTSWDQLIPKIVAHRKAMGLHIGLEFEQEVETQLCQKFPDECTSEDPSFPAPVRISFKDVLHGTSVLASLKISGDPLVSLEEATRRAGICGNCPYNVAYAAGCTSCTVIHEVVTSIIGNVMTKYDDSLRACAICHCLNKAHIWVPLEHLAKGVTDEMRAKFKKVANCWKQV